MILWDVLSSLFVGLLFTGVFVIGFGKVRAWWSIFTAFVLIFLAVWAGGKWVTPLYPELHGAMWLPHAIIGLAVVLFLAAGASIHGIPHARGNMASNAETEIQKPFINYSYWALIVFLAVAIITEYFSASEVRPPSAGTGGIGSLTVPVAIDSLTQTKSTPGPSSAERRKQQ